MKAYYPVLDGVRGLAALAVLVHHMSIFFGPGHLVDAYLAVDLFFILSGVVIANAYEGKLQAGMSFGDFLARRLIRLYPMLVVGIALGIANVFWGPPRPGLRDYLVVSVLLTALFLPNPVVTISPIVGPAWSLIYEMAANILYALGLKRLTSRVLVIGCALALTGLVVAAIFKGHLDVGRTMKSLPFGLCRVGFSFFAGVLLYRLHSAGAFRRFEGKGGALAALAIGVGAVAVLVVEATGLVRQIYVLLAVAAAFPVIVVAGMCTIVRGRMEQACRLLGDLSYPLYVIHFPLIMMIGFQLRSAGLTGPQMAGAGVATIVGVCVLSLVLARVFDEPVRARLTTLWRDWRTSRAAKSAEA